MDAVKEQTDRQDQFVELLSDWFQENKQTSEKLQSAADTELLGSGLLDSFDFLDLIVHIGVQNGPQDPNLSVADPNQFSLVRGLWNLATGGDDAGPTQLGSNGSAVPAERSLKRSGQKLTDPNPTIKSWMLVCCAARCMDEVELCVRLILM